RRSSGASCWSTPARLGNPVSTTGRCSRRTSTETAMCTLTLITSPASPSPCATRSARRIGTTSLACFGKNGNCARPTRPVSPLRSLLHGPDGRIRSAWRFFFAVLVIYAATWRLAGYVASTLHPVYDLGWESIYRSLLALTELAAFVLFARSLDGADPALPALG